MSALPPEDLTFDRQALTVLAAVFAAARPAEGCALLLGETRPRWHVRRIWPALNAWPVLQERCQRFGLDPREQLLAQRWARQRGLTVLGCAHSHPNSVPQPSATDLELTLAPALMVIAGREPHAVGPDDWSWAGWWLPESEPGQPAQTAWPVPWRMGTDSLAAAVIARPVAHASS